MQQESSCHKVNWDFNLQLKVNRVSCNRALQGCRIYIQDYQVLHKMGYFSNSAFEERKRETIFYSIIVSFTTQSYSKDTECIAVENNEQYLQKVCSKTVLNATSKTHNLYSRVLG